MPQLCRAYTPSAVTFRQQYVLKPLLVKNLKNWHPCITWLSAGDSTNEITALFRSCALSNVDASSFPSVSNTEKSTLKFLSIRRSYSEVSDLKSCLFLHSLDLYHVHFSQTLKAKIFSFLDSYIILMQNSKRRGNIFLCISSDITKIHILMSIHCSQIPYMDIFPAFCLVWFFCCFPTNRWNRFSAETGEPLKAFSRHNFFKQSSTSEPQFYI